MCVCILKKAAGLLPSLPLLLSVLLAAFLRQALFQTDLGFPASQWRDPPSAAARGWSKELCLCPGNVDFGEGEVALAFEEPIGRAEVWVPTKEDTTACTWWLLACFLRYNCCPRIPTRDLYFCRELENDQELSYEDQRQTASMGAWLLRQTKNSKAVLLLEHEATPSDLTAVSVTGWEVSARQPDVVVGETYPVQLGIWDPWLPLKWRKALGYGGQKAFGAVPHPSFQLIEKHSWKAGVLERASLKTWLKNNLSMLFIYLQKHVSLIKAFYSYFLWDHCLRAGKYILKLNHSLIFILYL